MPRPVGYNAAMKLRNALSALNSAILRAQPVFTFAVFLSVLLGSPPLWAAWLIAVIPLALRLMTTGRLTRRTPFDIPILISIGAMGFGLWLSPDRQLGLTLLNTYLACVLLYYGIVNNSDAPAGYWVLWGVFISAVLLFLSFETFQSGIGRRVVFNEWAYKLAASTDCSSSLKIDTNTPGDACAVVIPGLVSLVLFRQRPWLRWSAGVLAAVFTFIIVLSASPGGWLAAIAGLLFVLMAFNYKVFWTFLISLGIAAASIFVWVKPEWMYQVFSFPLYKLSRRVEIWGATVTALKDHPLTGFGLGGWWSSVPAQTAAEGTPHSAYLQLYSDTGVMGLIALIAAAIITFRLIWQIWRSDRNSPGFGMALGIGAGIVAGGAHALVEVNTNVLIPIRDTTIYFAIPFLWMWAAFCVAAHHRLARDTRH
jgi:hypothetical protein